MTWGVPGICVTAAANNNPYEGMTREEKWAALEPFARKLADAREAWSALMGQPSVESVKAELDHELAQREFDDQKRNIFFL